MVSSSGGVCGGRPRGGSSSSNSSNHIIFDLSEIDQNSLWQYLILEIRADVYKIDIS